MTNSQSHTLLTFKNLAILVSMGMSMSAARTKKGSPKCVLRIVANLTFFYNDAGALGRTLVLVLKLRPSRRAKRASNARSRTR